jgi:CheY-like chemotaxis protein
MSKSKILVVDDEKAICSFVKFVIQEKGYDVILAHDGEHALEVLSKNKDVKLILSDVMMPKMTGTELLQRVQEDYSDIKEFYLMTGFAKVDKEIALKLGAKGLLSKPLDLSLIEEIITKLD